MQNSYTDVQGNGRRDPLPPLPAEMQSTEDARLPRAFALRPNCSTALQHLLVRSSDSLGHCLDGISEGTFDTSMLSTGRSSVKL